MDGVGYEVLHRAEAGGVVEVERAQGEFGSVAQEPRRGDEAVRVQPELAEFRPGLADDPQRVRAGDVEELTLVLGVNAGGQLLADGFGRALVAVMEVAVNNRFVPAGHARLEPAAEIGVVADMPAPMVIRDDEQGKLPDAKGFEVGENALNSRARVRGDVVNGDDESPAGGMGGMGGGSRQISTL